MNDRRVSIVVSRGQSQNPRKRALEDAIVAALETDPRFDIYIVPHLYDVRPDSETARVLRDVQGDLVVFSWSYERAGLWTLQRNGIRGEQGEVLLRSQEEDSEEDAEEDGEESAEEAKERVKDQWEMPPRKIYSVNLNAAREADAFVEEAQRILREGGDQPGLMDWIQGSPTAEQMQRYLRPSGNGDSKGHAATRVDENVDRRWYPVIDFSRCTNCMECIDFCLFGVYGVDAVETILVEQPDNCRKGCPACSRVCPENAIIFPQHKTPAIAGAAVETGGFKIDLSKLFGAPDAIEVAARERDEQLELAGRAAVGLSVGMPKRQQDKPAEAHDDLDDLLDELDDLDL